MTTSETGLYESVGGLLLRVSECESVGVCNTLHPVPSTLIMIYLQSECITNLLDFLAPNTMFIGQPEKDIGRRVSGVQYPSAADQ